MSEPFLAEIRMVGFNFAPRGYAFCDGQILPISQNQALYSLLGTTYGGDGRITFALPDLRGRTPIHVSSAFRQGQTGGEEVHALTAAEMPQHTHTLQASTAAADSSVPENNVPAQSGQIYRRSGALVSMNSATLAGVGGRAHDNMQPYLVINFIIALQGLFPSRS